VLAEIQYKANMNILYLNHFRGFETTYIPLKQVNFFVGENSTGKSSILSILRLLSSPQFWNDDDFNTADVEMGFFDELVSKNFKINHKEFQIGFLANKEQKIDRIFNTLLLNYKNVKSVPTLNEIRFLVQNTSFKVTITNKQFKIFSKIVDYDVNDLENFQKWIEDNNFTEIKYKILKREDDYTSRSPYFELKYFLKRELENSKEIGTLTQPRFLPFSTWIAPIRSKPKRIYENFKLVFSPEGDHTPLLIKSILANDFKKNITKDKFLKAIEKFGKNSGLFDRIEVESLGNQKNSPFHLNIFVNNIPLKITNVGYGVGQVLPLLTEILVTVKGRWFTIQQPEVHLHPRAQAALGNFIFDATISDDKNFLIETHSDFLIDRFRYCIKKNNNNISAQVLFFERYEHGNKVSAIEISKLGQYPEELPDAFRSFFINEELNLLSL
jgi:predicted ATPase